MDKLHNLEQQFLTDSDQVLLDSIHYIDEVQRHGTAHNDAVWNVLSNYEIVLRQYVTEDKLVAALVTRLGENLTSYYKRETNG